MLGIELEHRNSLPKMEIEPLQSEVVLGAGYVLTRQWVPHGTPPMSGIQG